MSRIEISIIGAGLSGLTCAYRLQQKGYQISIYEALNRSGGRVLTHFSRNSHEELGGKFLNDGGDAHYTTALVQELGLGIDFKEIPFTKNYVYKGKFLPFNSLLKTLPPANEKTYQQLKKIASSSQNLREIFDQFFKEQPLIIHFFELLMRGYEGSSSSALSVKYLDLFWSFYKRDLENLSLEKQGIQPTFTVNTVKGGNSQLVYALQKTMSDCIYHRMPLKKIKKQMSGKLLLQFENGQEKITDYLILTIPVPLLKEIAIDEDLLPFDGRKIFNHLPFGSNSKILIPISSLAPVTPEFGYTEDAIAWFNADYSLMTLYFGGEVAQFSDDPASIQRIYLQELSTLKLLYPQILFPSEQEVIGISWPKQPYFKGSYSNYGLELFDFLHEVIFIHDIPIKKIFAPLENSVFFAGEATAIDFPSTMEGAIESAEHISRLVQKVIEAKF